MALVLVGLAAGVLVGTKMSAGGSVGPPSPPSGAGMSAEATVGDAPLAGLSVPPPLTGAEVLSLSCPVYPSPSVDLDDSVVLAGPRGLRKPLFLTISSVPLVTLCIPGALPLAPKLYS